MLSKNLTKLGYLGRTNTQRTTIPFYDEGTPSLDLNFAGNRNLVDNVSGNNLVTFTRASSGTYVDSDGLVKTAATNLLLRSEEFDNASWVKTNATVTADSIAAPNGTVTADKLIENSASGVHFASRQTTVSTGQAYTFSIYMKAAERSWSAIQGFDGIGNATAYFNLSSGVVGTTLGCTAAVSNAGGGWFRCSITYTVSTGTLTASSVYLATNDNSANYLGDNTSGIYIWGGQLEQSSTVGEYIPTTSTINSAPRFDHNPTTGESLGLLVEEQRTNICAQSEDFSQNQAIDNVSVTTNQVIAPDGTTTADLVTSTLAATPNTCWVQQLSVVTASTATYVISCFVKQGTSPSVSLNIAMTGGTFDQAFANFNFSTKTIGIGGGGAASATAGYQQLGNGWFRLWLSLPNNNTGTGVSHRVYTRSEGSSNVVGDSVYLWGRATEVGAFPTSYIPTTTTAVTRSADMASISGTNFSSWYRQDEGTVFVSSALIASSYTSGVLWDVGASGAFGTTAYGAWSGTQWTLNPNSAPLNMFCTVTAPAQSASAYALKANDSSIAAAGLIGTLDASCAMPASATTLSIGKAGWTAGNYFNGTIRRLTYWPTRLSNTTLQNITR